MSVPLLKRIKHNMLFYIGSADYPPAAHLRDFLKTAVDPCPALPGHEVGA